MVHAVITQCMHIKQVTVYIDLIFSWLFSCFGLKWEITPACIAYGAIYLGVLVL